MWILTIVFAVSTQIAAQEIDSQTQSAIELQAERLRASDAETRRDAAHRLRILENAAAARVAASALKDKSEIVRATAAEAAAFLPDAEAAAVLTPLLTKDKSEFARREAAFALGEARSKSAVPALIQALQTDKKPGVRAAAAIALGKIGDARASNALSQILLLPDTKKNRKTVDEFTRRSAARSLGQIRDKSAVPSLIIALRDAKNAADTRREAARSLGAIADRSAVDVLRENANADDYLLAEIARSALQQIEFSNVD